MKRSLVLLVLLLGSLAGASMLDSPWDISALNISTEIEKVYDLDQIRVEEIYYTGRPYRQKPTRIFGYLCHPRVAFRSLPAILIVHGGGGSASRARAVSWARHGYVTLAIDLPGKGERRLGSRSTGPDMEVSQLLLAGPDISENYLVHAVAAARQAITYLSQRDEVDKKRIGMIGLSWGGVITLLTNGQDQRLAAAVNVFGAGHIPEVCTWQERFNAFSTEEKSRWDELLDPSNFLKTQHAPLLFVTGTNDHCYYLPTFQKSYQEAACSKSLWLIANQKHRFLPEMEEICLSWFDKMLKGKENQVKLFVQEPYQYDPATIIVSASFESESLVKNIKLFFSESGPQNWTKIKWQKLEPIHLDQAARTCYFEIPTRLLLPEILFFISAQNLAQGVCSTPVRSLFRVKLNDDQQTFGLTSMIRNLYRHEPPISLLNGLEIRNLMFSYSKPDRAYKVLKIKDNLLQ